MNCDGYVEINLKIKIINNKTCNLCKKLTFDSHNIPLILVSLMETIYKDLIYIEELMNTNNSKILFQY